jgi:hypothetical protein
VRLGSKEAVSAWSQDAEAIPHSGAGRRDQLSDAGHGEEMSLDVPSHRTAYLKLTL